MISKIQNNFIQAYIDLNKTLVKTLLIKSSFAPFAINREIRLAYGPNAVDEFDPLSWKYYKNLAGEYHFTDVPMNVISLDTREEILFSTENLKRHTATAEGYRYGTRYYHALLAQYPQQEFLIHGVLTPCDKQKAVDAEDGSILAFPSGLVEEFETTLIMELESFIKLYNSRWDVKAFALTDPYYGAVQRSLLSMHLLPKLLNLRLKRCKTDEVHSFHLREYLASHQGLDRWLPYLTREQALWLYRNINYLERNAGKTDNFDALLENILNKRRIPVTDYSIRQLASFDQQGYPVLQARRKKISLANPATQEPYVPLSEFYSKEVKTTYGNPKYFALAEEQMTHAMAVCPSSVIQTKDLESAMVDLTDSVPDPLPEVMMRQWLAMTHQGLYDVSVNFQDPKTSQSYSLMSWDAIVYVLYLTCKMEKIPFEKVPKAANVKFRLHPRPYAEELTKLIEPGMGWLRPIADELVSSQPVLVKCTSVSMFYQMTYKIYQECLKHWYLLAGTHDLYARGVLEQMILKLFGSSLRDFSEGEDAEVWRVRNNLPAFDRTYDESLALVKEIFERATGYRVDETKQLRHIQHALISLFETLSSYSIQFIREINDGRMLMAGGTSLRLGNIGEMVEDDTRVHLGIHALKADGKIRDEIYVHSQLNESFTAIEGHWKDHLVLDHGSKLDISTEDKVPVATYHLATNFDLKIQLPDPVTGNMVTYPNLSLDKLLSQDQLKALKLIGE